MKSKGEISHDQVDFTHCRVFGAESTIDFNASDAGPKDKFGTVALDDTLRPLPGGLQISVKLRSRVSSDMAVGTLIDGVVSEDLKDKHSVIIPSGSPVHGRIRRLERYANPLAYYVVGIEFTEVEVRGIRHLFYADPIDMDRAPGVEQTLSTVTAVMREHVVIHDLAGVATFFFKGARLDLPPNFQTVWKTRALK